MTVGEVRGSRTTVLCIVLAVLLVHSLTGCGRSRPARVQVAEEDRPKPPVATTPEVPVVTVDPKFKQSFADATRKDPVPDFEPVVTTMTGKSIGKLYTQIVESWDATPLVTPEGKYLAYTAKLDTEAGPITLQLRSDWAPNHVRNFVALARAGYYDGLLFERVIQQQYVAEDPSLPRVEVQAVTAGCPIGTGEYGKDSLGYWLKPEFVKDLPHQEGIVAACHGEEDDSACCRFYISLCKTQTPTLDGHYTAFAKVVQGLDVVRKIWQAPVRVASEDLEGDHRPEKPVVITKVTIASKEVDKPGPADEN